MLTTSNTKTATILIVEDDERTVALYARMLRIEGYNVRTAVTAQAGLEDVVASPPDALILDFRMPDMDGIEFLRRLRTFDELRHLPVTIATGVCFLDDTIPNALRELGAEIRHKPLWLTDLADIGLKLCQGR